MRLINAPFRNRRGVAAPLLESPCASRESETTASSIDAGDNNKMNIERNTEKRNMRTLWGNMSSESISSILRFPGSLMLKSTVSWSSGVVGPEESAHAIYKDQMTSGSGGVREQLTRVQRHWAGVTEVALARRRDARQLLRLQQRCSWDTPIGCNILHGRCTGRNADCRDRCVNDLASVRVGQTHRGRSSGHDGRY